MINTIETACALLLTVIMTGLGMYIISSYRKSRLHLALAGIIFSLMFHLIFNYIADNTSNYSVALFTAQTTAILTAIPITLFLYISYIYPKHNKSLNLKTKLHLLIPLLMIVSITYTPLNITYIEIRDWGLYFEPGPLYLIFLFVLFIPQFGGGIYNFIKYFKKSTSVEVKQIGYIVKGWVFAAFVGLIMQMIFPLFFNMPQTSVIGPYLLDFLLVAPLVYSLTRYRFLDLKLIFKYILQYASIASSYALLGVLVVFSLQIHPIWSVLSSLVLLTGLFFIKHINTGFKNLWNIIFFKNYSSYQDLEFKDFDMNNIVSIFQQNLKNFFGISSMAFVAANSAQADSLAKMEMFSSIPIHFTDNKDFITWADQTKEVIVKDELEYLKRIGSLNEDKINKTKKELDRFYAAIGIPIRTPGNKFVGVLLLGSKAKNEVYYVQEINKIRELIEQIIIYLYRLQTLERSHQDLSITPSLKKKLLHNVNTPLTVAHNQAEELSWDETDQVKKDKLQKIQSNIKKASGALKDVVDEALLENNPELKNELLLNKPDQSGKF